MFKPFWGYFALIIGILIFLNIINTFTPYLFGKSVDAVIAKDVDLTIKLILTSFGLAVFSRVFIEFFIEYLETKFIDEKILEKFSLDSLKKMFGFSIGQHTNEHSGVSQVVVNKGQNALFSLLTMVFYGMFPLTIQILVVSVILFIFDYRIASITTIFVAIYIFISIYRNKKIFPQVEEIRNKDIEQSKMQSELFRNASLVIAEAKEDFSYNKFKKKREDFTIFSINTWVKYLKSFYSHRIIILLGQFGALGLGIYLIMIGEHSTGMFVTLFSWIGSIFGYLQQLMINSRRVMHNIAEIKKYFELLDIKPDIDLNENGVIIENLNGKIEFKNVNFVYPFRKSSKDDSITKGKLKDALKDVSFVIPPKAKIGFVGLSGSGKSTIINLIRRYYDTTSGNILIDDIDIKDFNLRWLRSQMGSVEQNIKLFDSSVRDNILFGAHDENIDEETIKEVLKNSSLDDFVNKLDHGLDTLIGEGGIKISGGERQRIGIARALIKNPKIIIFDEATSALDSVNEKKIHEAINASSKDRTTIIVAHRLSTIKDADIIFVVKDGEIVDSGTHKELENNSAEYKMLIENQILN